MARPRKLTRHRTRGLRAVVYVRVSTAEQANPEHFGIAAQEDACRAYLARQGYSEVGCYADLGLSGARAIEQRPGLLAALMTCERGDADVVVCYAQDRLARKSGVFDAIRERAVHHHYRLEVAREGQDLTTEDNELSSDVMAFVAGIERKMITRRLYGGRRQRGRHDGRGSGPLPYGYRRTLEGIEVDAAAAAVIRTLLRMRDAGATYQATADHLNAAGHATPQGSRWTAGHVQGVERHATLYRTGQRTWGGLRAEQRWPPIMEE